VDEAKVSKEEGLLLLVLKGVRVVNVELAMGSPSSVHCHKQAEGILWGAA
jgi:hypothetical protein